MIALSVSAGCGYRLAGKADLDPVFESTHVSYQNLGQKMAKLLEERFKANQIELVDQDEASALVTVLYEQTERDILSVDEEGKVREYELILTVGIDVQDSRGKKLINNQSVRLSRSFLFEISEVLGKTSEEQQIYDEMRADAARLIIYRLQAISSEVEEK